MSRAAYMREYRKKRKAAPVQTEGPRDVRPRVDDGDNGDGTFQEWAVMDVRAENKRLIEEVHRLKRALAQANRDLILSRVNRSK